MSAHLLLVEDEMSLAVGLVDVLRVKGYLVDHVVTGEEALAGTDDYALILLDASLPGMSGFEVLQKLRQRRCQTPVLMLTARGSEADRVLGFELGGDDYVVKPFSLAELLGRIAALLRRCAPPSALLQFGSVQVDLEAFLVRGRDVVLPTRAFQLLKQLQARRGQAVPRDTLMDEVENITLKTLTNLIVKLRQAIEENPEQPRYLKTVHGVGYRLEL